MKTRGKSVFQGRGAVESPDSKAPSKQQDRQCFPDRRCEWKGQRPRLRLSSDQPSLCAHPRETFWLVVFAFWEGELVCPRMTLSSLLSLASAVSLTQTCHLRRKNLEDLLNQSDHDLVSEALKTTTIPTIITKLLTGVGGDAVPFLGW